MHTNGIPEGGAPPQGEAPVDGRAPFTMSTVEELVDEFRNTRGLYPHDDNIQPLTLKLNDSLGRMHTAIDKSMQAHPSGRNTPMRINSSTSLPSALGGQTQTSSSGSQSQSALRQTMSQKDLRWRSPLLQPLHPPGFSPAAAQAPAIASPHKRLTRFERNRIGRLMADIVLDVAELCATCNVSLGEETNLLMPVNLETPRVDQTPFLTPFLEFEDPDIAVSHMLLEGERGEDERRSSDVGMPLPIPSNHVVPPGSDQSRSSQSQSLQGQMNNSLGAKFVLSVTSVAPPHDSASLKKFYKLVEKVNNLIVNDQLSEKEFEDMQLRYVIPRVYPPASVDALTPLQQAAPDPNSGNQSPLMRARSPNGKPPNPSSSHSLSPSQQSIVSEGSTRVLAEGGIELIEGGAKRHVTMDEMDYFRALVRERVRSLEGDEFIERIDMRSQANSPQVSFRKIPSREKVM